MQRGKEVLPLGYLGQRGGPGSQQLAGRGKEGASVSSTGNDMMEVGKNGCGDGGKETMDTESTEKICLY